MDAQSVKTVQESAHISGFDAFKRVTGRKRHLLVDTLGIPLSYYVTPADQLICTIRKVLADSLVD